MNCRAGHIFLCIRALVYSLYCSLSAFGRPSWSLFGEHQIVAKQVEEALGLHTQAAAEHRKQGVDYGDTAQNLESQPSQTQCLSPQTVRAAVMLGFEFPLPVFSFHCFFEITKTFFLVIDKLPFPRLSAD